MARQYLLCKIQDILDKNNPVLLVTHYLIAVSALMTRMMNSLNVII